MKEKKKNQLLLKYQFFTETFFDCNKTMPRTSTESGGSRRSRYSKATTPVSMSSLIHSNGHHVDPMESSHLVQMNGMRTPVAWTLRDANLSRPPSASFGNGHQYSTMSNSSHQRYPPSMSSNHPPMSQPRGHRRPSSPSATTTSSDDRDEIPMVRTSRHRPPSHASRGMITSDRRSVISRPSRPPSHMTMAPGHPHHPMAPGHHSMIPPQELVSFPHLLGHHHPIMSNGTLRSTKSVPALAMIPPNCPVHGEGFNPHHQPIYGPMYQQGSGMRRVGSLVDIRSMHPGGSYTLVNYKPGKKISKKIMKNVPQQFQLDPLPFPLPPPMMMANFDGGPDAHFPPPQLPPPQHFKLIPPSLPTAKMMIPNDHHDTACCKGHLIVLWIILAVVTLGVISGIVLAVTMN